MVPEIVVYKSQNGETKERYCRNKTQVQTSPYLEDRHSSTKRALVSRRQQEPSRRERFTLRRSTGAARWPRIVHRQGFHSGPRWSPLASHSASVDVAPVAESALMVDEHV